MSDKNRGWVKLWREQFSHEISERKPWCDGYAWSYLYSRANFRPTIVNFRNQYIPVERGQFVTSKSKLQAIFGWSKKRTNSFLTSLEVGGMSAIRTTNRFIIITIRNYDKFQSTEDEKEPTEGTTEGATESPQRATEKNEENVKNKKTFLSDSIEIRLSELLLENILSRNPNFKKPNIQSWAKDIDLMSRIDNRPTEEIRRVIQWCQNDPFWQGNILSTSKLRKQFDQLQVKMQGINTKGGAGIAPSPSAEEALKCPRCSRRIVVKADLTNGGCVYCEFEHKEVTA
ncbi:MAG: hypothetical protein WCJ37_03495 [Syntrophus sp. (in: bacteria)]